MDNHAYEPPPTYTEVIGKPHFPSSNDRAAAYAVSPPEYVGSVKYTVPNETMSNNYGVQINSPIRLGDKPVHCTCPNCHSLVVTDVRDTPSLLAWILCLILILCGCWIGCCFIPFCIPGIQNVQHYCPQCKTLLGEYRPL